MHVRTIEDRRAGGWEKVVDSGRVRSLRYVSAADRVGFSLHLNVSESGDGRQPSLPTSLRPRLPLELVEGGGGEQR